jgi:two-component system sensor histidine kinase UhpB
VRGLSSRGLIPQFVLVVILPLLVLFLAIPLGSLALHQKAMRDLVGERDERTARSVARAVGEQLAHRLTSIRGLAIHTDEGIAPDRILGSASYLLPDFDGGLAFYSVDGDLVAPGENDRPIPIAPPDFSSLLARAALEPTFSSPFSDPASGELFLLVVASADRKLIAVGAFSVTALIRSTLADAFLAGDQASVFVLDSSDRTLYRTGRLPLSMHNANHPGVKEALSGQSGTTYMPQTADSSEHVVAYSPIRPMNWALVIEESWELIDNPLLRTTQAAPLVLIPPFVVVLVALWFGIRQIVRPLQALASHAAELAWGRFGAIEPPVGGVIEIRHLQTELIHMARKLKAAQTGLRDYISAITAGQEEERRRLARELHDDTLQALIALNQRTHLARLSLADSPADAPLAEIQTLMEQTMANLRRLTGALRPIYLEDLGLVAALEVLARETGQSADLAVEFRRTGVERRLAAEVELALYRMAQEALSNVTRHAQATRAALAIEFSQEGTVLTVSDNGILQDVKVVYAYETGTHQPFHYSTTRIEFGTKVLQLPLTIWTQRGYNSDLAQYYKRVNSYGIQVEIGSF